MSKGTCEIITFRVTRHDPPYSTSLHALSKGISTGHIALRLTFDDKELYEKYIAANPHIPHSERIVPCKYDAAGKGMATTEYKTEYEVYTSFWPASDWSYKSESSALKTHIHDCEQSALFSPFSYSETDRKYFKPLEKLVAPQLPIGREYFISAITLPPSIFLHTSRIGMAFGKPRKGHYLPEPNTAVMTAAEKFALRYKEWRETIVITQNIILTDPENDAAIKQAKRNTRIANILLTRSKRELRDLMYPQQSLNDAEFLTKLEAFITLGQPEKDTISFKINDDDGLRLEPMLRLIQDIANNPTKYPYNLFSLNCTNIVCNILWEGIRSSNNKKLIQDFLLARYEDWLGTTLTPALLMHDLAAIERHTAGHDRELMLHRYSSTVAEDDEELPTTKLGIMCEAVSRCDAYLRT